MGVVYKARQTKLNRLVALKMILAGNHAGAADLTRFQTEAEAIARLQHPNIVQVYEVGEHEGKPFFSLEFCPGGSLEKKLRGTPLPPAEAARLGETLARAMQAAHEKNVIHRDLKPANVLLAEDGTPKITDFGLAKKLDDVGQTASGTIMGTPSFMSPEQAGGKSKEIGPAADVYALGAILYKLLTGRPPFKAATALDTVLQVMSDEPVAVRQLQPKTPRDLETICLKCLRKEPGKRYATALELAEDLHRFLNDEPISARPAGRLERARRWCQRNPARTIAAGLALLVLVAAIVLPVTFAVYEAETARRLGQEHEQTLTALDKAEAGNRLAEQRLREVREVAAASMLDRALQMCEQGDINHGLLWLLRALELAREGEAANLEQAIRWNLSAWSREVHPLIQVLPHPDEVNAATVSPDGHLVATGCKDGTVRFWELASGQPARQPLQHPAAVTALAFRPGDGQTVLTGSADGVARLWTGLGDKPAVLFPHRKKVTSVAFRPDGQAVLTASQDGIAQVWEADTGQPVGPPLEHRLPINGAAFSPDGKTVLTASDYWFLRFWQVPAGKLIGKPLSLPSTITSVAFSPDGKAVLAGTMEFRAAYLLEAATGKLLLPPCQHRDEISTVAFSPDGTRFLTAGRDQTARLWEVRGGRPVGCRLLHAGDVTAVAFSPDGHTLVTASKDKTVRLWRVASGCLRHTLAHLFIRGVAFSPDSQTIATAGGKGAFLWKTATGERLGPAFAGTVWVQGVAFSPDGKVLLTGGNNGTAQLWDLATGNPVGPACAHGGEIWRVAFAPDGKSFLTGGLQFRESPPLSRAARLWDVATGKSIGEPLQHGGSVRGLAYLPDSIVVLTGSDDGTTRAWDPATGAPLGPLVRHADEVRALAFSPDGRLLATGGTRAAQLWDGMTWKPIGPALQQEGAIEGLAFSPDGRFLLTGGTDATARLWHTATGKPIGPLLRHASHVRGVALSPDGRAALTGSEDGTAKVWEMPTALPHEAEALAVWVQVLTGMELDDTGSVRILDAPSWQNGRGRLQDKHPQ